MKSFILIALLFGTLTLTAQKSYYVDANLQITKKKVAIYQITVIPQDTTFYVVAKDLTKRKIWQGAFKDKKLTVKHGLHAQFKNNQKTIETFYKNNLKDGEECFFDSTGKIKQMQFYIKDTNITPLHFNDSTLAIIENGKKYGLANKYGEIVAPITYNSLRRNRYTKTFIASKQGASTLFDLQGEVKLKTDYDEIIPSEPTDGNWVLRVKKNDLWGIIDLAGKLLIPSEYQEINHIRSKNIYEIRQNGLFGLINLQNKILIAPKYLGITFAPRFSEEDMGEKVAGIKYEAGKYSIYNVLKEKVIHIIHDEDKNNMYEFEWHSMSYNNLRKSYVTINLYYQKDKKINKKYYPAGAFSLDNVIDIPFEFEAVHLEHQNLPNMAKKGGKYGFIDLKGKVIVPLKYERTNGFDTQTQMGEVFIKNICFNVDKNGKIFPKKEIEYNLYKVLSGDPPAESNSYSKNEEGSDKATKGRELDQDKATKEGELDKDKATKEELPYYTISKSDKKEGYFQINFGDKIIGTVVANYCVFIESLGIFQIYSSGEKSYLNPLLKPLFPFEHSNASFD